MKIHLKETKNLSIPATATSHSSGYDVVVMEDPKIVGNLDIHRKGLPDRWHSIDYIEYKTGLFIAPQTDQYQHNYHTLIFPRSSIRKYNLVLANSIGLIDNDYRGEIILCFKYLWQPENYRFNIDINSTDSVPFNYTITGIIDENKIYKKGDKIGQIVSEVSNPIDWIVVADLSTTQRGTDGFGSTDKKIETPKEASSLINKWKEVGDVPIPQKYETVAKEREKLIS